MIAQDIFASLGFAWQSLPMPLIFVYAILLGMVWLYAEFLVTRTARATPGWRRPLPVMPWISEVMVWGVRASTWFIWAWIILYAALVSGLLLQQITGSSAVLDALSGPIGYWHDGYALLVQYLPGPVLGMLPGV